MNILYVHGFGSKFSGDSEKIKSLSKIGNLTGFDYDYTASPVNTVKTLKDVMIEADTDILVGTSLGGWYAAVVGSKLGVPFVSINPAIDPVNSLSKHVGNGADHYGRGYYLDPENVADYNLFEFPTNGHGIALIDMGDEVINPNAINEINPLFAVHSFEGGSHRFEHMEESLPLIVGMYGRALAG